MTYRPTNPIHLYRGLLREITYLADPNARTYIRDYVTTYYRKKGGPVNKQQWQCLGHQDVRLPTLDERYYLKRGRKFLSTLQRANEGHMIPFNNVIGLTYGRKGRRRRQIMSEIMAEEVDDEPSASTVQSTTDEHAAVRRSVKKFDRNWKPSPAFKTLLNSQFGIQRHVDSRGKLTRAPRIAAQNNWGLPMPACRVKNQTKAWYARHAGNLLPPLDQHEWLSIKEKAERGGFTIPKRRPLALVKVFHHAEEIPGHIGHSRLLCGPQNRMNLRQKKAMSQAHQLTPRFLRRRYQVLLENTPMAEVTKTAQKGTKMRVSWATGQSRVIQIHRPVDPVQQRLVFDS